MFEGVCVFDDGNYNLGHCGLILAGDCDSLVIHVSISVQGFNKVR